MCVVCAARGPRGPQPSGNGTLGLPHSTTLTESTYSLFRELKTFVFFRELPPEHGEFKRQTFFFFFFERNVSVPLSREVNDP